MIQWSPSGIGFVNGALIITQNFTSPVQKTNSTADLYNGAGGIIFNVRKGYKVVASLSRITVQCTPTMEFVHESNTDPFNTFTINSNAEYNFILNTDQDLDKEEQAFKITSSFKSTCNGFIKWAFLEMESYDLAPYIGLPFGMESTPPTYISSSFVVTVPPEKIVQFVVNNLLKATNCEFYLAYPKSTYKESLTMIQGVDSFSFDYVPFDANETESFEIHAISVDGKTKCKSKYKLDLTERPSQANFTIRDPALFYVPPIETLDMNMVLGAAIGGGMGLILIITLIVIVVIVAVCCMRKNSKIDSDNDSVHSFHDKNSQQGSDQREIDRMPSRGHMDAHLEEQEDGLSSEEGYYDEENV